MPDEGAVGNAFDASRLIDEAQRAYWVALRATRSPSLAEDAVQEAYASFLRHPPQCGGEEHMRRCFLAAVRRQALMLLRSEKNRKKREQMFAEAAPRSVDATDTAAAAGEEIARAARAFLDSLPAEEREAVSLCCEQGFSLQKAAEILGSNKMTVSRRVNRGLEKLRRIMVAQGYAAATPLAVSGALSSLPLPPAPPAMRAALERLASDPALAAEYAAKVSARMRSLASAKKRAVSGAAWGAGVTAAGVFAACALVLFNSPSSPPPPGRRGAAAAPTGAADAVARGEKLHRRWTFRDNAEAAKELQIVIGSWRWERDADGIGRMIPEGSVRSHGRIFENASAFLLPCEIPPRPMILVLKGISSGDASFSADWAGTEGPVARKLWRWNDPDHEPGGETGRRTTTVRIVFLGRYKLGFIDDVFGGLTEYEKEYPTGRIGCAFVRYHLEEVELRELEPEEVRKFQSFLEGKLAEAAKRGLKAASVPHERFRPE
ncbi:MAG: sigma-70 family RNA polymerase sigma factor [Planctomycetota bacterium]|nr:sigma-70 family RNA polymerase sigma factor [Planctomycetota bacterium]